MTITQSTATGLNGNGEICHVIIEGKPRLMMKYSR